MSSNLQHSARKIFLQVFLLRWNRGTSSFTFTRTPGAINLEADLNVFTRRQNVEEASLTLTRWGLPHFLSFCFYFHGSDSSTSMEVCGSWWKWHGSWWKRRGSAIEPRGSRMEVKIGFMEADGTSWNQNTTSMEVLT